MTTSGKVFTGFILIIVLLLGGYFAYAPSRENTETIPPRAEGKKMAFIQTAEQGNTSKCYVTYYTGDTPNTATVFLANKMIRAQFGNTSFVTRDGSSYGWNSATATMGTYVNANTKEGGYTLASYQLGDYTCEDWTPDATLFFIPATIKFNPSI